MNFGNNRLSLATHEINILFGQAGLRPSELPDEPSIDWETIKPLLHRIQATSNRTNLEVMRRTSGVDDVNFGAAEPVTTIKLGEEGDESVREVPRALGVLARRALAHERAVAKRSLLPGYRSGSIAVRQRLADEFEALISDPRNVVLEVYCPEYDLESDVEAGEPQE